MLGVVENPLRTPSDEVMEKVATDMGVADTFHPTPVGVFFGGPGQPAGEEVADPFFGGAGPERNTCLNCGECMTGCRHNAKNTLVKNYLYLAEQNGATVLPLTTVTRISPRAGGGYDVRVKFTKAKSNRGQKVLTAEHVVMAAASLGQTYADPRRGDRRDQPGVALEGRRAGPARGGRPPLRRVPLPARHHRCCRGRCRSASAASPTGSFRSSARCASTECPSTPTAAGAARTPPVRPSRRDQATAGPGSSRPSPPSAPALVLAFLLSIATNNPRLYERHYVWLFWVNVGWRACWCW